MFVTEGLPSVNRWCDGPMSLSPIGLQGASTTRNPRLLLRFDGVLLRFAERQFCALLFQLPPRFTRFWPDLCHATFDTRFLTTGRHRHIRYRVETVFR